MTDNVSSYRCQPVKLIKNNFPSGYQKHSCVMSLYKGLIQVFTGTSNITENKISLNKGWFIKLFKTKYLYNMGVDNRF